MAIEVKDNWCTYKNQAHLNVHRHDVYSYKITIISSRVVILDFCTFCDQLFTELDVHKQDRISCKLADSILNELFKGATEVDAETETLRLGIIFC